MSCQSVPLSLFLSLSKSVRLNLSVSFTLSRDSVGEGHGVCKGEREREIERVSILCGRNKSMIFFLMDTGADTVQDNVEHC